eukprot:1341209-Amorphochlora_amoeboformis.AAC.1
MASASASMVEFPADIAPSRCLVALEKIFLELESELKIPLDNVSASDNEIIKLSKRGGGETDEKRSKGAWGGVRERRRSMVFME